MAGFGKIGNFRFLFLNQKFALIEKSAVRFLKYFFQASGIANYRYKNPY